MCKPYKITLVFAIYSKFCGEEGFISAHPCYKARSIFIKDTLHIFMEILSHDTYWDHNISVLLGFIISHFVK